MQSRLQRDQRSAQTEGPAAAKANGVVAPSSGNHGFAVAYAAALLKVKARDRRARQRPRRSRQAAIVRTGAELIRLEPTAVAAGTEDEELLDHLALESGTD